MLINWWKFNHPLDSEISLGGYRITRMDWDTIFSVIPLDPKKWKYTAIYRYLSGDSSHTHLVYSPTGNWNRRSLTSTFDEANKMIVIQLSFFDYLKFRKYQRNKEKLTQQEEERAKIKADNEIKMMILENAQKDINKMREQAAKEIEKSAEYLRAAATSPHKPCLVEVSQGHLEDVYELCRQRHEAAILDRTVPGHFMRWKVEQEKLKTAAPQSEIDTLSNAWTSLTSSAGVSYIESSTSH